MVPFATLRGSAVELKLKVLEDDKEIRRLFSAHFKEVEGYDTGIQRAQTV
jgi:hypothetical protein